MQRSSIHLTRKSSWRKSWTQNPSTSKKPKKIRIGLHKKDTAIPLKLLNTELLVSFTRPKDPLTIRDFLKRYPTISSWTLMRLHYLTKIKKKERERKLTNTMATTIKMKRDLLKKPKQYHFFSNSFVLSFNSFLLIYYRMLKKQRTPLEAMKIPRKWKKKRRKKKKWLKKKNNKQRNST